MGNRLLLRSPRIGNLLGARAYRRVGSVDAWRRKRSYHFPHTCHSLENVQFPTAEIRRILPPCSPVPISKTNTDFIAPEILRCFMNCICYLFNANPLRFKRTPNERRIYKYNSHVTQRLDINWSVFRIRIGLPKILLEIFKRYWKNHPYRSYVL